MPNFDCHITRLIPLDEKGQEIAGKQLLKYLTNGAEGGKVEHDGLAERMASLKHSAYKEVRVERKKVDSRLEKSAALDAAETRRKELAALEPKEEPTKELSK